MDDQEEYTDAASVQVPDRKSGFGDLRSRFESKNNAPPTLKPFVNSAKPNVTPKPAVGQKPKWGSSSPSASEPMPLDKEDKVDNSKPDPTKKGGNTTTSSLGTNRMSYNVKTPNAFHNQTVSPVQKFGNKPTVAVKRMNDTNNNSDAKDTKSETADMKKEYTETKPLMNGVSTNVNTSEGAPRVSAFKAKFSMFEKTENESIPFPKPKPAVTPKKIFTKPAANASPRDLASELVLRVKYKSALRPVHTRKSTIRNNDGKKFYSVEESLIKNNKSPAPEKPSKLDVEIDWESLHDDFNAAVRRLKDTDKGASESVEEIYEDGMSEDRPVSEIRPMSEGEELESFKPVLPPPPADMLVPQASDWPEDVYDDAMGLVSDDVYDEASSKLEEPPEEVGGEELYEPLADVVGDEPPPEEKPGPLPTRDAPPPPPPSSAKTKTSKQLEAEQKKQKKKEEEQRKKDEEEKKKELEKKKKANQSICKTFKKDHLKVEDLEAALAQGRIKRSAKGKGHDLTVQENDMVEIVRMDITAKGKWIVRQLEGQKVGYVDSDNVEVETKNIRDMMEGLASKTPNASVSSLPVQDEDGEMYEDVGEGAEPEEDGEAIYEAI